MEYSQPLDCFLMKLGRCLAFQHFQIKSRQDGMGWCETEWYLHVILSRGTMKLKELLLSALTMFLQTILSYGHGSVLHKMIPNNLSEGHLAMGRSSNNSMLLVEI